MSNIKMRMISVLSIVLMVSFIGCIGCKQSPVIPDILNPQVVSLTATPLEVTKGETSVITFQSLNGDRHILRIGTEIYNVEPSGTLTTQPLTENTLVVFEVWKGGEKAERSLTITVKEPPMTVQFITPTNGQTVSGDIDIKGTAFSANGISKIEFYRDVKLVRTVNSNTFDSFWVTTYVSNGSYTLKLIAYDNAGKTATTEITVHVRN
jgi:hypothetical protein